MSRVRCPAVDPNSAKQFSRQHETNCYARGTVYGRTCKHSIPRVTARAAWYFLQSLPTLDSTRSHDLITFEAASARTVGCRLRALVRRYGCSKDPRCSSNTPRSCGF